MKVEIYSDIACPWCYIGEKRFSRALAALPESDEVEVVFRPFQLDPSLPETPHPLKEHLAEKFGPRTEAMLRQTEAKGRKEGVELRFDEAQAVNTFTAHRLLWLAEEEAGPAVQRALAEKLFEAYFANGANIADDKLLVDLAASVGIERERGEAFLASDEGTADVWKQIESARRIGVTAVPTFVFGSKSAVQGAQPTSTFLQVLEEQVEEAAEVEPSEACADGACNT